VNAIVVGTDGSPGAEAAVRKVIELASGRDGQVHLVCAYPGRSTLERIGMSARQETVDMRGVAADVIARDARRLEEAGFTVEKHVREGDPAHVLLDVAEEQHADLIVVGAQGNTGGARRFSLGGVASKLSHHAPASVLIVREA
jgi:nucleotide-binding universal stress UspA family protein